MVNPFRASMILGTPGSGKSYVSMDVMGISKEELIDGINYGGVGQYLGETEKSNNNLFI